MACCALGSMLGVKCANINKSKFQNSFYSLIVECSHYLGNRICYIWIFALGYKYPKQGLKQWRSLSLAYNCLTVSIQSDMVAPQYRGHKPLLPCCSAVPGHCPRLQSKMDHYTHLPISGWEGDRVREGHSFYFKEHISEVARTKQWKRTQSHRYTHCKGGWVI